MTTVINDDACIRGLGSGIGSGGSGIPDGGTTGQILTKLSAANGHANWEPLLYTQSITINPVVSGTPVVVSLTGSSTPYDKQTVVVFLVSAKTSTSINYTIQLYTQGTDGTIVVYQTANLTGNYSDVIPFTIDRNLLADDLFLMITNTGTGTISDMVVRLVSVGV